MEELISVIVPVYNIERYIDRCVGSVVNQTYKNLEIILVDDGSTDGSAVVCDKWKDRDFRIKVIHKKNGGLSDARNVGIKIATGQFYSFIDGDDEISSNMLERLYTELVNSNAEISMCRMEKIEYTQRYVTRQFPVSDNRIELTGKEATGLLFRDIIDCSACLKLYKCEVFKTVEFPYGKTNEDFAVLYKLFSRAKRVVYISDILYYYYFRENSITSTGFNNSQFDKIDNCLEMMEYVKANIPELMQEAKFYLYLHAMYLLKTLCVMGLREKYYHRYTQLIAILRRGTCDILRFRWISLKEKGMYLFLAWFPNLYTRRKGFC
jgi:glycosyltransferase involved in cell wall biosynthesis